MNEPSVKLRITRYQMKINSRAIFVAKDMLRGLLIYSGGREPSFFGKRGRRGP